MAAICQQVVDVEGDVGVKLRPVFAFEERTHFVEACLQEVDLFDGESRIVLGFKAAGKVAELPDGFVDSRFERDGGVSHGRLRHWLREANRNSWNWHSSSSMSESNAGSTQTSWKASRARMRSDGLS
jgi:hypothetical protein